MSILFFHPTVANFVQQAARSLDEAGALEAFWTTLADRPQSPTQRILRRIMPAWESRFRRRTITEIPMDKVHYFPFGEIIRLLTAAVDPDGRTTDLVWEWAESAFDNRVAREVKSGLRGVYGFEYCARATFAKARRLGIATIYDVPAPEPHYVQLVLEKEAQRVPELRTPFFLHVAEREAQRIRNRREEWDAADLVLVNSEFTRSTYAADGRNMEKVRVVPLGAPTPIAEQDVRRSAGHGKLRLLWAGTFGIRKGAHLLLEAWKMAALHHRAALDVCGSVELPERLLRSVSAGVTFHGQVPADTLAHYYQSADVLIFPSLCDGFGMVVTEAWASGLPVITTNRVGAAHFLRDRENGLRIKAEEPEAIVEAVEWCLMHRTELAAMRLAARNTAAAWSWQDYRRLHALTLAEAGLLSKA